MTPKGPRSERETVINFNEEDTRPLTCGQNIEIAIVMVLLYAEIDICDVASADNSHGVVHDE